MAGCIFVSKRTSTPSSSRQGAREMTEQSGHMVSRFSVVRTLMCLDSMFRKENPTSGPNVSVGTSPLHFQKPKVQVSSRFTTKNSGSCTH